MTARFFKIPRAFLTLIICRTIKEPVDCKLIENCYLYEHSAAMQLFVKFNEIQLMFTEPLRNDSATDSSYVREFVTLVDEYILEPSECSTSCRR